MPIQLSSITIADLIPDVVYLQKQIKIASSTWYSAIDLVNDFYFFPHPYQRDGTKTLYIHIKEITVCIYNLVTGYVKTLLCSVKI